MYRKSKQSDLTPEKFELPVAKKRRPTRKERRQAITLGVPASPIAGQLQYIKRNLLHIEKLINCGAELTSLSRRKYKMLLVITEVYRQQLWMDENKSTRIDDRIASINQPHIRPIVRGKAGKPVEFGAKLSVSCFDNYVFLDHLSWDNFNESGDFQDQIEAYKNFTGYYPSSVHVDKIYRTKANLAFCKERGIRISGPPLGRPAKNVSKEMKKRTARAEETSALGRSKKQALDDERFRNAIEGKFGQAKRRFSLNLVMTKLSQTSETSIAITFLDINLSTLLRQINCLFLDLFLQNYKLGLICECFIVKANRTACLLK